ncbi:MAG: hypothetical protein LQ342_005053 [Letrouitia transgressa]|nr:MAG: hypothetical protein LQ342_005053 [Letrouitia transgressa]
MRKFGWFVVAMVAPEYFWMEATDDNMLAEAYVYYLKSLQKDAWTTSHLRFSLARGFKERTSQSAIRTDKLVSLIADNHIDEPPMSKNELKDRGKADLIAVILAILQLLWFGIQELGRYLNSLIITPLEILTVAFTFSAIYIYIVCWEKPQDVNYPIILDLDPSVQVDEDTLRKVKTSVKEHKYKRLMFLAAAGAFFGGFHCIAWNYPFPTLEERIIWRTCAPLTAVLPILSSLVLMYRSYRNLENGKKIHGALSIPYAIARLAIIGLAFSSIRALPASVFEKVNWTNYIPHLGG